MQHNIRLGIDFPVPQQLAPAPYYNYHGSAMVTAEERYIFYLYGYGSATFWRYDMWTDTWQQMTSAPATPSTGGYASALVFDASKFRIYAVFGGSTTFAYYDIRKNYWVTCAVVPLTTGSGCSLEHTDSTIFPGANDDHIYYFAGDGSSRKLYRYVISTNTWAELGTDVIPAACAYNSMMYWMYGVDPDKIMIIRGNGTRTVYIYSISGNNIYYTFTISNGYSISTGSVSAYEPTLGQLFWVDSGQRNINKTRVGTIPLLDNGTATSGAANSITCSSKTWTVNRFAGSQVCIISGTGVGQQRTILSNTSTALTVSINWTVNPDATSVFEIHAIEITDEGLATSATTTTLVDSTKSWVVDRYSGSTVTIIYGTGVGQVKRLTGNTSTTLSIYGTWEVTPDTTSRYEIKRDVLDFGSVSSSSTTVITDSSRAAVASENWPSNTFANVGIVRIISGTGVGQMRYISANATNTLTVPTSSPNHTFTVAPDATSKYEILGWRTDSEIYIPYSTSASYYGNTMVTAIIKGLLFVYCYRKGGLYDWFRYLSVTP